MRVNTRINSSVLCSLYKSHPHSQLSVFLSQSSLLLTITSCIKENVHDAYMVHEHVFIYTGLCMGYSFVCLDFLTQMNTANPRIPNSNNKTPITIDIALQMSLTFECFGSQFCVPLFNASCILPIQIIQ